MSPPRLLRQLIPLLCMISAIAIFTSALFRTHDVPIKDLKISNRWLSRSKDTRGEEDEQSKLSSGLAGDGLEHGPLSKEGLTGESGLLVEATEKDWGTAELTDEDLSPGNVDAILKTEWVYDEENEEATIPDRGDYRELFSLTTHDRKFFAIYHENGTIYDANIMPHPSQHDAWIVMAQNQYPNKGQVICQSGFLNGILICGDERVPLELQQSGVKGLCGADELEAYKDDTKTVNARMFYSPEVPYVRYAAPSQRTCYGQKLQDGRRLLHAFAVEQFTGQQTFKRPTELQKPGAYKGIEKDYFLFWDTKGKTYVHHELWPKRMFAELDIDGSVGPNLAAETTVKDQLCMAKYMPRLEDDFYEKIEQGTNSLSLTLCKRKDPLCKPTESNTHVAAIFNVASNYEDHVVYEPYLLLFSQKAPFGLTAISQRPFWIHGRDVLSTNSSSMQYFGKESEIPEGHTERFNIAGMSWKTHGQKYHGFIDDVVLLGLGIEDSRAAGMDVMAGDLIEDLAFC